LKSAKYSSNIRNCAIGARLNAISLLLNSLDLDGLLLLDTEPKASFDRAFLDLDLDLLFTGERDFLFGIFIYTVIKRPVKKTVIDNNKWRG
jgi:hypothetical protein